MMYTNIKMDGEVKTLLFNTLTFNQINCLLFEISLSLGEGGEIIPQSYRQKSSLPVSKIELPHYLIGSQEAWIGQEHKCIIPFLWSVITCVKLPTRVVSILHLCLIN